MSNVSQELVPSFVPAETLKSGSRQKLRATPGSGLKGDSQMVSCLLL